MGFWSALGQMVGEEIKAQNDKANQMREDMEKEYNRAKYWDDDKLKREYRRAAEAKRYPQQGAYAKLLKERGYGK